MKKIAIQGVRGAFHEIAARNYHEQTIEVISAITFNELITKSEEHDGGVMAIENSIAGTLIQNFPLIRNSKLNITGEIYLRIKHNLMALPGQQIEDINTVFSHPMAIAQCRPFFEQYHPHIRLVEAEDTALSAKKVADGKLKGSAAIASNMAAQLYELEILAAGIETNKQNYTRFFSLESKEQKIDQSSFEKASVCFALPHEVGSLHNILSLLADYGANLTKIQSFPIMGNRWNYMFYVDFVLQDTNEFENTIQALSHKASDLTILGRYQTGIHYEN